MPNIFYHVNVALLAGEVGVNAEGVSVNKDEPRDLSRLGAGGRTNNSDGCVRRFRPRSSIMELLEADSSFYRTVELIEHLELRLMIENSDPLTLFAPRNIAFDSADTNLVARLYQQPYLMHAQDIFKYHIANDRICSLQLGSGDEIQTANGEQFTSSASSDSYTLNGGNSALILDADEQASNGVLHAIDQILLPQWIFQELVDLFEEMSEYSIMNQLVVAASMEDVFSDASGRLTVFAPTNVAFERLGHTLVECLLLDPDASTTVLRSHTVEGLHTSMSLRSGTYDTLQIGEPISISSVFSFPSGEVSLSIASNNREANVIDMDKLAFSGVLHGTDSVLLPAGFTCGFNQDSVGGTIPGKLAEEGLTTLAGMVSQAGLTTFFSDATASYTLFAPDDVAFGDLSYETISCLNNSPQALQSLLKYHTLETSYYASDLEVVELVQTTDGKSVLINGLTASDGLTQVNDAGVTAGDIIASNGIIHKISRVVHATGAPCM